MNPSNMPPIESGPGTGYETRDVNLKAVLSLGMAIIVLTFMAFTGLWWLLERYQDRAARRGSPPFTLGGARSHAPLTQITKRPRDYEDFLDEQNRHLNSYGWIDKQQGIVRIPISRSIELALERGLPTPVPGKNATNETIPGKQATDEKK